MRRFWLLTAFSLGLPASLWGQASETAIVKQEVQLQQQGPADTQIADYFEQLKANPNDPQVHLKLGELYFERKLYELAISSFQQALRLQPHFAAAHADLSKAFRKKKLPVLELSEMEAAVADDPDDMQLRFKLGVLYMEPEHFDYKKAKQQLDVLKKAQSPLAAQLGGKMGIVD